MCGQCGCFRQLFSAWTTFRTFELTSASCMKYANEPNTSTVNRPITHDGVQVCVWGKGLSCLLQSISAVLLRTWIACLCRQLCTTHLHRPWRRAWPPRRVQVNCSCPCPSNRRTARQHRVSTHVCTIIARCRRRQSTHTHCDTPVDVWQCDDMSVSKGVLWAGRWCRRSSESSSRNWSSRADRAYRRRDVVVTRTRATMRGCACRSTNRTRAFTNTAPCAKPYPWWVCPGRRCAVCSTSSCPEAVGLVSSSVRVTPVLGCRHAHIGLALFVRQWNRIRQSIYGVRIQHRLCTVPRQLSKRAFLEKGKIVQSTKLLLSNV